MEKLEGMGVYEIRGRFKKGSPLFGVDIRVPYLRKLTSQSAYAPKSRRPESLKPEPFGSQNNCLGFRV